MMLVAHPKKPDEQDKKGRASLYDIAGSADFYNKCDYGIILRRDKELKLTFVNVLKIRFQHLGRIGSVPFASTARLAAMPVATSGRMIMPKGRR